MSVKSEPLVSICCLTFNHELFIRQCLDGFLIQETDFKYEILIHDDASTDHTPQIIREYEENYPDIIKPIYQSENQYSKGISVTWKYQYPRAKGKYIAFCEGDDYWTDPLKLKKQVEFLELNTDYGLVHTAYKCYVEAEQRYENINLNIHTGNILQDLIKDNELGTLTVLLKRDVIKNSFYSEIYNKIFLIDYAVWLYTAENNKIGYINECTAVYRKLPESMSNTNNPIKKQIFKEKVLSIKIFFAKRNNHLSLITGQVSEFYKNKLYLCYIRKEKQEGISAYRNLLEYCTTPELRYRLFYIALKYSPFYSLVRFLTK